MSEYNFPYRIKPEDNSTPINITSPDRQALHPRRAIHLDIVGKKLVNLSVFGTREQAGYSWITLTDEEVDNLITALTYYKERKNDVRGIF